MIPITCNAVGDILALTGLVIDTVRALNDARGSASEYRTFTKELNELHSILLAAARIAENTSGHALREEIFRTVDQCGKDVQDALARVAKFSSLAEDLVPGSGMRRRVAKTRYKLEWRFVRRNEVQTVRQDLAKATQRLTTLFIISQADGAEQFRTTVMRRFDALVAQNHTLSTAINRNTASGTQRNDRHRDDTLVRDLYESLPEGVDSQVAVVAVLCAAICAMGPYDQVAPKALLLFLIFVMSRSSGKRDRALVQSVSYTEDNAVTLFDALGRRLTLPFELCESYDVRDIHSIRGHALLLINAKLFHNTLVILFSQTAGRWFIDSRRYRIWRTYPYDISRGGRYDLKARKLIYHSYRQYTHPTSRRWTSLIQPGTVLEMAVVVEQQSSVLDDSRSEENTGKRGNGRIMGGFTCPVCPRQHLTETHDESRSSPQYIYYTCDGCGRVLTDHRYGHDSTHEGWLPVNAIPNVPQEVMDDRGRFPRSRPRASSFLPRTHSGHDLSLPEEGNHAIVPLSWESQIRDFVRIDIRYLGSPLSIGGSDPYYAAASPQDHGGLMTAAQNGRSDIVSALLDEGVDANSSNRYGYTALHLASLYGHTNVIGVLLGRGAYIDAVAAEADWTPLALAVLHEQRDVTSLLLARGALTDAPQSAQAAILYVAAIRGKIGLVHLILRLGVHVDTQLAPHRGETALHAAVRSGSRDIVSLLLQYGADASLYPGRDQHGCSPLSLALDRAYGGNTLARDNKTRIAELLLVSVMETKRTWHSKMDEKQRIDVFYCAIRGNSPKLIDYILRNGVDVNAQSDKGLTPLVEAVNGNRTEAVNHLLARGGDPDGDAIPRPWQRMGIKGSWKALHAASFQSHYKVAEIFLRHGVDVNVQTERGFTPLSYALESWAQDYLYGAGVYPGRCETVEWLLSNGGEVYDGRSLSLLRKFNAAVNGGRNRAWDSPARSILPGTWNGEGEDS